jgi:hypothetical protein
MHIQFQQFNPFRDPQWRYERCLKLVEHRPRPLNASPRRDDEYVRRYRKFLLRFLRDESEEARAALFPLDPALFYAHLIHHHPDREWRSIAQARLLSGATDDEIAQLSGTLPETINLYEQLFFNVRDRLDNKDWIVKTILGTVTQRSSNRYDTMTDHQRDSLYKLFGYFGGPVILDVIISGFASKDLPTSPKHVSGWFDRTMKTLIKRRATIEAHRFEVDKFKVMELMHIHLSIITSEKESGSGPATDYDKCISEMLTQTPWGVAKKGFRQLNQDQQKFALSPVEPRADEQMQLAFGKVPATLIEREEHTKHAMLLLTESPGE